MFIGHYALAFAGKKATPRTSLGTWLVAVQLLDLIWPVLLLCGVERVSITTSTNPFLILDFVHYPWSHSLLSAAILSVLFGTIYLVLRRDRRAAILLGAGVLSHWVLDFLSHRPDLPLYPGSAKYGLGLWNHPMATNAVELLLFATGVGLYQRATGPEDRTGTWSFVSFVIFLLMIAAANLQGTPPPSVNALAWVALATWLFPLWGWWFDRHRKVSQGL